MSTVSTPPSSTLSTPSPTELPTRSGRTLTFTDPFVEDSKMSASRRIIKTTVTTITPITMHPKPIYLIVATSLNPPMGIGYRGQLPWPQVKADMAFFKKVTSNVAPSETPEASTASTSTPTASSSSSRTVNAVIMGRKTWESIPSKFRPLSDRLNVIVTRGKTADLGRRIVAELKAANSGSEWSVHELPGPSSKSKRTKSDTDSTILTPPHTSGSSPGPAPILISPSLPSTLSLLSKPAPMKLPSPPDDRPNSVSVDKIFCIGGAEIYRQLLSLSAAHSDRAPPAAGSETDTDTDGEGDGEFEVRILQTQIRASPSTEQASASPLSLSKQRSQIDFECDTFFPDLLPADPRIKSTKWKVVPPERVAEWVDGVPVPQDLNVEEDDDDDEDKWYKDEKARVEIRVVGWERRGARSDSVISLPPNYKPSK